MVPWFRQANCRTETRICTSNAHNIAKGLSDNYAKDFIAHLVSGMNISSNLQVETHPDLAFNHRNVDKLPGLYDTKENISDVGVISLSDQGSDEKRTNLVNIEIKSSPN